jgi:hypothetical protein
MNEPSYPSRPPTETHILAHLDTLARRQSELSLDGKLREGLRIWHAESEVLLRAAGDCVKRDYAARKAARAIVATGGAHSKQASDDHDQHADL